MEEEIRKRITESYEMGFDDGRESSQNYSDGYDAGYDAGYETASRDYQSKDDSEEYEQRYRDGYQDALNNILDEFEYSLKFRLFLNKPTFDERQERFLTNLLEECSDRVLARLWRGFFK